MPALNDRHLAFRNRVVPLPVPMLASRARYLVVHRDVEAEELAVELPAGVPLALEPAAGEPLPRASARWRRPSSSG